MSVFECLSAFICLSPHVLKSITSLRSPFMSMKAVVIIYLKTCISFLNYNIHLKVNILSMVVERKAHKLLSVLIKIQVHFASSVVSNDSWMFYSCLIMNIYPCSLNLLHHKWTLNTFLLFFQMAILFISYSWIIVQVLGTIGSVYDRHLAVGMAC